MKIKNPYTILEKPQPNWEGAKSKLTALLNTRINDKELSFDDLRNSEPALKDWPDGHIYMLCNELGIDIIVEP